MSDVAIVLAVIGIAMAAVLYVTRQGPTPPPTRDPSFDALERVVEKAFEANEKIITTIAAEVSRTAIESARGALEGMTVGGTQQVLDTDDPAPPDVPDWTAAHIPDFINTEPFPNPPTPPGEMPDAHLR